MESILTTENILIFSLIVLVVSLYILYEIIKSASRGKKIHIEAQKQTKLLVEIAKKNGVSENILNDIIDDAQYQSSLAEEKKE